MEGIVYAGNYGAEVGDIPWAGSGLESFYDRALLEEDLARLREVMAWIPGVLIEGKTITASVHFRQVPIPMGKLFHHLFSLAGDYDRVFALRSGKKVFEIPSPPGPGQRGDPGVHFREGGRGPAPHLCRR